MTTDPRRVLLTTGSREFDREDLVRKELLLLERPIIIMHGGAKGADRLVSQVIQGEHMSDPPTGQPGMFEVKVPYLQAYGRRGGHKRNEIMVKMLCGFRDAGYDCWAMAFLYDILVPSPGTAGMVRWLHRYDFAVVHINGAYYPDGADPDETSSEDETGVPYGRPSEG